MSRILIRERKARRDYRCSRTRQDCAGISVGATYQLESLPPHTEFNECDSWSTFRTCIACRDADQEDRFRWVRSNYGVPVTVDLPVRFDGRPGRIVDVEGGHLLLAMDDGSEVNVHPKWRMEYPVAAGVES